MTNQTDAKMALFRLIKLAQSARQDINSAYMAGLFPNMEMKARMVSIDSFVTDLEVIKAALEDQIDNAGVGDEEHVVAKILTALFGDDYMNEVSINSIGLFEDWVRKSNRPTSPPDGFVMVKKGEQSNEVLMAGMNAFNNSFGSPLTRVQASFDAMIAAAQKEQNAK